MDTYTLEVTAPFVKDPSDEDEEQLSSALEAVATTHGGIVIVEHSDVLARLSYHRRYLNAVDCAGSVAKVTLFQTSLNFWIDIAGARTYLSPSRAFWERSDSPALSSSGGRPAADCPGRIGTSLGQGIHWPY